MNRAPYYLLVLSLCVSVKFYFLHTDTEGILFLIAPLNFLVSSILGISSTYIADSGFYLEAYDILISKSCSGHNFWLIAFLTLSLTVLRYRFGSLKMTLLILFAFFQAYVLTIAANSFRIISAIYINRVTDSFIENQDLIHQMVGILNSISFVLIIYFLAEFILNKTQQHIPNEKSIKS